MRRKSLKMQEADWLALEKLAAKTKSLYSGKPSWRRMMLRIARRELVVESPPVTSPQRSS
jgi:hypothetical protein